MHGVLALKAACKAFQTSADQLLGGERGRGRSRSREEHKMDAVCRLAFSSLVLFLGCSAVYQGTVKSQAQSMVPGK